MQTQNNIFDNMSRCDMLVALHINASRLAGTLDTGMMVENIKSIYGMREKDRVLHLKTAKLVSYCYPYLIFMMATSYKNTIECLNEALQTEIIIDNIPDDNAAELRKAMTLYKLKKDENIIMGKTTFSDKQLADFSNTCHVVFKSCAKSKQIPEKAYKIENRHNADVTTILSSPVHIIRAFANNHIFRKEIKQLVKDFKNDYNV